jgi:hypothetical protein
MGIAETRDQSLVPRGNVDLMFEFTANLNTGARHLRETYR